MGMQFERITVTPVTSLTLIVDDLMRHRRDRESLPKAAQVAADKGIDGEAWLNALQRQSEPLVASKSGRENLAAWLEAVEADAALAR